MKELRIIIAGGRGFDDYALLRKETLRIIKDAVGNIPKENVKIISGTAKGADRLGERFANEFGLTLKRFPADWTKGKGAGYARNVQMAQYAYCVGEECQEDIRGVLIAFWDGQSKGTKHMIDIAKKMGLSVHVVSYNSY